MDRIDALRAFVRVVELGSFSAAATELRRKQSTLSKWVQALEDEMGTTLLERTTRSQRLTEAGQCLLDGARELLERYDETTSRVQMRSPDVRGRLRVSAPVVFGTRHLIPHIASFAAAHPDLEVDLVLDDRYVNLVDDNFDVAIRVGRPEDSSFRARTLLRSSRWLVASPAYLSTSGEPAGVEGVCDHPALLHSGLDSGAVWTFEREGETKRATVRGRLAANNSEALRQYAIAGLGVALLAPWLVASDCAQGTLVRLLADWTPAPAPVQAVMPPGRFTPPRVRRLLDHLRDAWLASGPIGVEVCC